MEYPFQFKELLLTSRILDALGFSPYWDGSGDFGTRSLVFSDGSVYSLHEMDERNSDGQEDYGGVAEYCPQYFINNDFSRHLYFLHDLYEEIYKSGNLLGLAEFIVSTQKEDVNMWPALSSYLTYKENQPK